eukprot:TRINITY_DN11295_c4_g1_i1.p1 TRINITY_DN11295_c4_g1~~TRINITY_DN11295_c4_g1_i1.p1  ORF type:complete len:664 (+),score=81.08 TRINITY_DN11295_c4_g1_i1:107-2098(+)
MDQWRSIVQRGKDRFTEWFRQHVHEPPSPDGAARVLRVLPPWSRVHSYSCAMVPWQEFMPGRPEGERAAAWDALPLEQLFHGKRAPPGALWLNTEHDAFPSGAACEYVLFAGRLRELVGVADANRGGLVNGWPCWICAANSAAMIVMGPDGWEVTSCAQAALGAAGPQQGALPRIRARPARGWEEYQRWPDEVDEWIIEDPTIREGVRSNLTQVTTLPVVDHSAPGSVVQLTRIPTQASALARSRLQQRDLQQLHWAIVSTNGPLLKLHCYELDRLELQCTGADLRPSSILRVGAAADPPSAARPSSPAAGAAGLGGAPASAAPLHRSPSPTAAWRGGPATGATFPAAPLPAPSAAGAARGSAVAPAASPSQPLNSLASAPAGWPGGGAAASGALLYSQPSPSHAVPGGWTGTPLVSPPPSPPAAGGGRGAQASTGGPSPGRGTPAGRGRGAPAGGIPSQCGAWGQCGGPAWGQPAPAAARGPLAPPSPGGHAPPEAAAPPWGLQTGPWGGLGGPWGQPAAQQSPWQPPLGRGGPPSAVASGHGPGPSQQGAAVGVPAAAAHAPSAFPAFPAPHPAAGACSPAAVAAPLPSGVRLDAQEARAMDYAGFRARYGQAAAVRWDYATEVRRDSDGQLYTYCQFREVYTEGAHRAWAAAGPATPAAG